MTCQSEATAGPAIRGSMSPRDATQRTCKWPRNFTSRSDRSGCQMSTIRVIRVSCRRRQERRHQLRPATGKVPEIKRVTGPADPRARASNLLYMPVCLSHVTCRYAHAAPQQRRGARRDPVSSRYKTVATHLAIMPRLVLERIVECHRSPRRNLSCVVRDAQPRAVCAD
eukprot:COSAG06_NODE_12966_length_1307_cov_9.869132_2_plen_169_part_00